VIGGVALSFHWRTAISDSSGLTSLVGKAIAR